MDTISVNSKDDIPIKEDKNIIFDFLVEIVRRHGYRSIVHIDNSGKIVGGILSGYNEDFISITSAYELVMNKSDNIIEVNGDYINMEPIEDLFVSTDECVLQLDKLHTMKNSSDLYIMVDYMLVYTGLGEAIFDLPKQLQGRVSITKWVHGSTIVANINKDSVIYKKSNNEDDVDYITNNGNKYIGVNINEISFDSIQINNTNYTYEEFITNLINADLLLPNVVNQEIPKRFNEPHGWLQ